MVLAILATGFPKGGDFDIPLWLPGKKRLCLTPREANLGSAPDAITR